MANSLTVYDLNPETTPLTYPYWSWATLDSSVLYNGSISMKMVGSIGVLGGDPTHYFHREVNTDWTGLSAGDSIGIVWYVKTDPSSTGTFVYPQLGARIGIDFYGATTLDLYGVAADYNYAEPPFESSLVPNSLIASNYVTMGTDWTPKTMRLRVPGSVRSDIWNGSGYNTFVPVGYIVWLQIYCGYIGGSLVEETGTAWYSNLGMYINESIPGDYGGGGTAAFGDSFETGDLSLWTGQSTSNGNVIANSLDSYTGDWSFRSYVSASAGAKAYIYYNFDDVTLAYYRSYIKFVDNLPSSGNQFLVASLQNQTNGLISEARVVNTGGTYSWRLAYLTGTVTSGTDYVTTINTDQWYCIELASAVSNGGGWSELYLDGSKVRSVYSLTNTSRGSINQITLGEEYSTGATEHSLVYDCVILNDEYIGLESGGGEGPTIDTFWEPAKRPGDPDTSGWGTIEDGRTWFNTVSGLLKYWNSQTIKVMKVL